MKALVLAALLAAAAPAAAQTPLQLKPGFAPVRMALTIRTQDGLGTMENDCTGYIQRAPVLEFEIAADERPAALEVRLESATDTVLAVVQPHERNWGGGMSGPDYCSDDEGGGVNPAVVLRDPQPGLYQVLAGAYERDVVAEVVLIVREPAAP